MDAQLQIRQNALEAQDYMQDLVNWTQTMNQKAGSKAGKQQTDQGAPSVRGKAEGRVQSAPEDLQRPALQPSTSSAAGKPPPAAHTYTHYSKWDKFNADVASDDEEQPSRKQQQPSAAQRSKPQQPAPLQQATSAANGSKKPAAAPKAVPQQVAPSATALKDRGNKLFQAGYFDDAIKCYTQSIGLQPTSVAYANRAMALLRLSRYAEAEQDCDAALQLDSTYIKALHRRGTARRQLGKLLEAAVDFEEALLLEPGNATVQADRDAAVEQYLQQQKIQPNSVWSSIPVVRQQQEELQQQQQSQQRKTPSASLQQQQQQMSPQAKPADAQQVVLQSPGTTSPELATAQQPGSNSSTAVEAAGAVPTSNLPSSGVTVSSAAVNAMSTAANVVETTSRSRSSPTVRPPPSRSPSPQQLATAAAAAAQLAARRAATWKAPRTSNDFEAAWRSFKGDQQLQAKYLSLVAPQQLPAIFKTSLTAPIFSALLRTALEAAAASGVDASINAGGANSRLTAAHAVALIEHMVSVPRFDMMAMCLTGKDKAPLKQLWDAATDVCEAELAECLAAARPRYRL